MAQVTVLYRVVNSETDPEGGLYNAFQMPPGSNLTLSSVKQRCQALHALNHLGPEGYHWRVFVEDKPAPGSSGKGALFSWWDIQDENARLPIKEASSTELSNFFMPGKKSTPSETSGSDAAKAAKGALKGLGKAMGAMTGGSDGNHDHGPRVPVIAFKLLDMVKMHDDFALKHGGRTEPHPRPVQPRGPHPAGTQVRTPAPARTPAPTHRHTAAPPRTQPRPQAPPRQPPSAPRPAPQPPRKPAGAEPSLMVFGDAPTGRHAPNLQHASSSPAAFSNETRAERLKREYTKKQQTANRKWDEVDQRWVEVEAPKVSAGAASVSAGKKKVVGISLDATNAVGKSANVQAAVNKRVNEMKDSQNKALTEIREREAKKVAAEAEEDSVRKRLEPRIKAWSEEHGKKKQLRALLATLHTILWPEANWKPITIGDILDDSKLKRCFHKASRVVHPDKTGDLDAEKRFLAKRIFDALSQAKTDFDNGVK